MCEERRTITIFSLPNELLEAIAAAGQEDRVAELYSSYYRDHTLDSYRENLSSLRDFKSEWTLSHVSHRFRDVIVAAPALWTLIDAHWSKRRFMKISELYLQRSKALKISATLRGSEQGYITNPDGSGFTAISTDDIQCAVLTQIFEHANRIKALRIELIAADEVEVLRSFPVVAAAPYLQHLEITHISDSWTYERESLTISLFSSTPRLRFLKIDGFQLQLPTSPWTAVTHLELRRFSGYPNPQTFDYFSAMAKCPSLVHLRIHMFFSVGGKDQIHIPTLKFLHVWIHNNLENDNLLLLDAVNLFDTPALTEFVVEGAHGDQIYTLLNSTGHLRSSFPVLISFSFISEDYGCRCDIDAYYSTVERRISPRPFAPFPALSTLTLINTCFTASLVHDLWGPESLPWPLLKRIMLCPPAILLDDVRNALQAVMDSKRQRGQPFPEVKLFHPLQKPENWHDDSFAAVEVEMFGQGSSARFGGDETAPEEV